jgi:hypothetical protein
MIASKREQVLSALFARLQAIPVATIRRNEALPQAVPAGGLVILRDGDPGEPDVTLNPRTEFYSHRAEIEAFVTQPTGGGADPHRPHHRHHRVSGQRSAGRLTLPPPENRT